MYHWQKLSGGNIPGPPFLEVGKGGEVGERKGGRGNGGKRGEEKGGKGRGLGNFAPPHPKNPGDATGPGYPTGIKTGTGVAVLLENWIIKKSIYRPYGLTMHAY